MADVDARTVRGFAGAPMAGAPLAKLNASPFDLRRLEVGGGLLDAFADVFARMSQPLAAPTAPLEPAQPAPIEEEADSHTEDESHRPPTAILLPASVDHDSTHSLDAESPELVITIEPSQDAIETGEHAFEVIAPVSVTSEPQTESSTIQPVIQNRRNVELSATDSPEVTSQDAERGVVSPETVVEVSPEVSPRKAEPKLVRPIPVSAESSLESQPTERLASAESIESASEVAQPVLPVEEQDSDHRRTRNHRQHSGNRGSLTEGKGPQPSAAGNEAAAHSGQSRLAAEIAAATESAPASTANFAPAGRPEQSASPTQATVQNLPQVAPAMARTTLGSSGSSTTTAAGKAANALSGISEGPSAAPAHAAASKRAEPTTKADLLARVKLIQRVSKAFQRLGPDGGSVRLRLAPAELGSVRVEMQVQDRKVRARVVAETEAASAALREHLPDLRSRLEAYGLQVEKIDVETEAFDSGTHTSQDSESQWQSEHHQRQPQGRRVPVSHRHANPSGEATESVSVQPRSPDRPGLGVDVRL